MKIDRLIGILSVLLQQDMVTAPFLAERFEVSRRTINRDIEDLCRAGIPIVTMPGAGGGISIMENYKVDRTVFTTREMQDILAGHPDRPVLLVQGGAGPQDRQHPGGHRRQAGTGISLFFTEDGRKKKD